jgi:hypothetical protein
LSFFANALKTKADKCSKTVLFIVDFTNLLFLYFIAQTVFRFYFLDCFKAALIKSTNNGCGFNTVLLYSGWYCTPTNQG